MIRIKMSFTGRTDFIANHGAAVVAALNINVSLRGNYMSEFRRYIRCNVNPLCIREIPN